MRMATKLARMVINFQELPPIMLFDPLVTFSCSITWQTKTIIINNKTRSWNNVAWWSKYYFDFKTDKIWYFSTTLMPIATMV